MWWNITPQNYSTIASGGTNLNCSNSNIVISASGNYFDTVWVNLTDGTSDYANVSYYVSYYATPPSIAITSPYNAQFLYNASDSITYPARFTITTPYLDECWYTYNSTVVYSCANFTMTLNGYNNYSLTVWANDTYGNVANANSTFTLANFTINSLFALFYNEENGLQLTDNFTLQVIGPRYSVNFSGGYNYSLQNLLTDIYNFRYSSANYVTRNFYVNISQGSTQTIKLYTLNSSKAQLVQFTITDTAGMPYVGATVSVYRFIIPTNSWEVIEMARSDQNGQGMLNLFPYSVNYKYSITDSDGQPIFYSSVPTVISSSSIYFNIPVINTMLPYWNLQNNLVHTLDFTNATSIFTFTWSDPSNSVVFGNLSIYRNNPQESVLVCSSKAYGTSGTVSCDLSVHDTTSTYHAVSYVMANGTLYQVDIYDKVFSSSASMWGISGAFLAMLIILILACMGLWNPSAALVFAGIGVLISSYFQLIPLSYMWIAGLLALIAIAIWRMRA